MLCHCRSAQSARHRQGLFWLPPGCTAARGKSLSSCRILWRSTPARRLSSIRRSGERRLSFGSSPVLKFCPDVHTYLFPMGALPHFDRPEVHAVHAQTANTHKNIPKTHFWCTCLSHFVQAWVRACFYVCVWCACACMLLRVLVRARVRMHT